MPDKCMIAINMDDRQWRSNTVGPSETLKLKT